MATPAKKRNLRHWPANFIFVVVCCACLLLAFVSVSQSYHEILRESGMSQENPSSTLTKAQFDDLKDRTDNLQKLITTLIALSSLYAIVLTVTGYLNVQKIVSEAQESLQDAIETREKLEKEYGSLTHISQNLEQVTSDLRQLLPDVQELSASFKELTPQEHERIYFQEKAIAFAQLVSPDKDPEISSRLSGAFVTLARFYRGRYLSTKNDEYRERAWFYAKQAVIHSRENFLAHNELGNCLLEYGRASEEHALAAFQESLRRNRSQQKARFSISTILHRRGDFQNAWELLNEALELELWETTKETARRNDLHYNRACACSRLAESFPAKSDGMYSRLDQALEDLKKANVSRSDLSKEILKTDLDARGDLYLLTTEPKYAAEVAKLI